ncbi:MAG: hypothetical protein OXE74_08725 [Cyanobacteria bacterium MAG CAR2_bin_4]|nr:hypothetical protein [Cyanobacteria bacterium MAG CAR2_bin_4]
MPPYTLSIIDNDQNICEGYGWPRQQWGSSLKHNWPMASPPPATASP